MSERIKSTMYCFIYFTLYTIAIYFLGISMQYSDILQLNRNRSDP